MPSRKKSPRKKSPQKKLRAHNSRARKSKGSPRKWKSPRTVFARRVMKKKCGSRCFLLPSKLKFPICDEDCSINPRGVIAAKIRSRQWRSKSKSYKQVTVKADRLINKGKFTKKSRKSPRKQTKRSRSS